MEGVLTMVEHGVYSVVLKGNLLSITLIGSFNELATKSACLQIQAKVDSLNGKAFGVYLIALAMKVVHLQHIKYPTIIFRG